MPGIGVFQRMFRPVLIFHSATAPCPSATPEALAPLNDGHGRAVSRGAVARSSGGGADETSEVSVELETRMKGDIVSSRARETWRSTKTLSTTLPRFTKRNSTPGF